MSVVKKLMRVQVNTVSSSESHLPVWNFYGYVTVLVFRILLTTAIAWRGDDARPARGVALLANICK